ncbi:hypothetical protein RVR_8695 [Actinacidiphila reveromycinica]|uniref:Uncharacterized protein n=1 Tax=Actinacidiphila reveromycinica TaxID=659352 RepID=A0A7U3VRZ7_9ACTN|nr:hypothetical protein RVR_8695 [Streptomyces sp. SN-593]
MVFATICLFFLAAVVGVHRLGIWGGVIRWVAAAADVLLVSLAVARRLTATRNSSHPTAVAALSGDSVSEIQRLAATRRLTVEQARLLALSIVKPDAVRDRVVESYETDHRTLHRKVTTDFRIDSRQYAGRSRRKRQYLALCVSAKGDMHDGFRVHAADGLALTTESHRDCLALVASMVRVLVLNAYRGHGLDVDDDLPPDAQDVERRALDLIINPGAREAPGVLTRQECEVVQQLGDLIPGNNQAKLAATLVEALISQYVVITSVPVPRDGVVSITYEQTVILSEDRSARASGGSGLKMILRRALGARPIVVKVRVDNAWTCRSFHLDVTGPEGFYLGRQAMEPDAAVWFAEHGGDTIERPDPYYRFRRRLGQRYAHFYARDFPEPKPGEKHPQLGFHFYEAPPGSDFRASLAAVCTVLLVWLTGLAVSNDALSAGASLGSDVPALLLALPAIAAGRLGGGLGLQGRSARSLSAVLSMIATFLISVAATTFFILRNAGNRLPRLNGALPQHLSVLGVDRAAWAVLIVLAAGNALAICYRWIVRTRIYDFLASRPPSGVEQG